MKIDIDKCFDYLNTEIDDAVKVIRRKDTDERTRTYYYGRRDTLLAIKWNLEDMCIGDK